MSHSLLYYSGRRRQRIRVQGVFEARQRAGTRPATAPAIRFPMSPATSGAQVMRLLLAQPRAIQSRFAVISESRTMIQPSDRGRTAVIPTE
ncbi:MAG: hypothetical protein ACRDTE_28960, partial [Pseudonocardiaceae bacterium]